MKHLLLSISYGAGYLQAVDVDIEGKDTVITTVGNEELTIKIEKAVTPPKFREGQVVMARHDFGEDKPTVISRVFPHYFGRGKSGYQVYGLSGVFKDAGLRTLTAEEIR
jgi:hypothetical protein